MTKRGRFVPIACLLVMIVGLMGTSSCNDPAKSAAVAVNKYANSLSAFQDAEIKMHNDGRVDAATHDAILRAEIVAAKAGQALDQGILAAKAGSSPEAYINAAITTLNALVPLVKANDPQAQAELTTLINTSNALLQNAITLIHTIKPVKAPTGSFLWLFLPMFAAAGMVSLQNWLALVNALSQLEPIAFNLIVQLAESLKGKSVEEVVAMSEQIFGKVVATAEAELAAGGQEPSKPPEG